MRKGSGAKRSRSTKDATPSTEPPVPANRDPLSIYAAPTVDTLDEPSHQKLSRSQQISGRRLVPSHPRTSSNNKVPPRPPNSKSHSHSVASGHKSRPKSTRRDFQHEEDAIRVSVRTIDLNERYAFEPIRLVSTQEWQQHVQEAERAGRTSVRKKMSPSLQYLELLHRMQNASQIRQLDFAPSLGLSSDVFVPWDDDLQPKERRVCRTSRTKSHKRDGRYRSIDPLAATMAVLPSKPPLLSNVKRRLPMRSDVGFPNASQKEIELKQEEILLETTWEEASPRLAVLVASNFLGTAIVDEPTRPLLQENIKWNNGGLAGMPLAGLNLLMAMERNKRLFAPTVEKKRWHAQRFEPNRTSMLAPPLDASYSSTVGWRPRPFHDRPPGRIHYLACPMQVQFDIGNVEPLVCSLAMYYLPGTSTNMAGKISEEFWFPAGDWEGLSLQLDAACALASGTSVTEVEESWRNQKHKAIFSYDPLDIGNHDTSSLYVVMQVHQVSRAEASKPYRVTSDPSAKSSPGAKRRLGGRIKSLGKGKLKVGGSSTRDLKQYTEEERTEKDTGKESKQVYSVFRTQFLTPLCFGIVPLLPRHTLVKGSTGTGLLNETEWPHGVEQQMQLYEFPLKSESDDEFIDRLTSLIAEDENQDSRLSKVGIADIRNAPSFDTASSVNTAATEEKTKSPSRMALVTPLGRERKHTSSRIFRSTSKKYVAAKSQVVSNAIGGTACVFTSLLGVDFLQSMLSTPHSLKPTGQNRLSRVLVDVSGDCAIAMDPQQPCLTTGNDDAKKRSSLVRLPQASSPSGYIDAAEIREILYIPPRGDKHYGIDVSGSSRSVINLLYLYPRLVRFLPDKNHKNGKRSRRSQKKRAGRHFTIRIRLLQSSTPVDEGTSSAGVHDAIDAFHNPASWAGSSLLKAVYTKVPRESSILESGGMEIALRDELKLNLPMILDGTYFLEFTLFEMDMDSERQLDGPHCGISLDMVGESLIPLSNTSLRETTSGVRIATVIPDGNHRVAIGNYQLQVETRLVSSIHANDTTVATALRDFPYDKGELNDNKSRMDLVLAPSRSSVATSANAEASIETRIPFRNVFAAASESAIFSCFTILVHMHLCNLVGGGRQHLNLSTRSFGSANGTGSENVGSDGEQFVLDNVHSLLEVLEKTKLKLERATDDSSKKLEFFFKNFLDTFDERVLLCHSSDESASLKTSHLERSQSRASTDATETSLPRRSSEDTGDASNDLENDPDSGAVIKNKSPLAAGNANSKRYQTLPSAISASGAPFSRVAYGASKTDRMRLEAEIFQGATHQLFDDDATVATFLTSRTFERSHQDPLTSTDSKVWDPADNDSVVDFTSYPDGERCPKGASSDSNAHVAEYGFAKRVRTAAQVMIAPCMAPALSTVLATGTTSPVRSQEKDAADLKDLKHSAAQRLGSAMYGSHIVDETELEAKTVTVCSNPFSPGTDTEDETPTESHLRGSAQLLLLSAAFFSPNQTDSPPYIYESVMITWLKTWVEHMKKFSQKGPGLVGSMISIEIEASSIPEIDFSLPTLKPISSFFTHMDFLLPLCLKSVVLRCHPSRQDSSVERRELDSGHLQIFLAFVEMLAYGVMTEALSKWKTDGERDSALFRALSSSQLVIEFLIGLLAIIHPEHFFQLVSKYFAILRKFENPSTASESDAHAAKAGLTWTDEHLFSVRCSRQVRLNSVELLATIPNFVALNYPKRFLERKERKETEKISWTLQAVSSKRASLGDENPDFSSQGATTRLPVTGWLSGLLIDECLLISSLACEAVVSEAVAQIESVETTSKSRPRASLKRKDLLQLQETAIQAIACVYELLVRRHAMDSRYQTEQSRCRVASVIAPAILDNALGSVRWLASMDATHKVRSLWLICFAYVLQEAPEGMMRERLLSYCSPPNFLLHRFVRLLRLSSATFQCFADTETNGVLPPSLDKISSWLMQESFNTICAATNMVVDQCMVPMESHPKEQIKMAQSVLDLLLHIITTPQSSVTHLRAIGGALQALEKFGAGLFLEAVKDGLQHWARVVLTLMNSLSLSVRTISTDFVVSLFGSIFSHYGNVDGVATVFLTVLPEVVGREIALFGVSSLLSKMDDVESAVWPLRRSVADIEEASPEDDNRIDPQLAPTLSTFCRACQAVVDGVLIEMRLRGDNFNVVGTRIAMKLDTSYLFDADEESLFEAANFFLSETAPLQRIRWLHTLKCLHVSKGQMVEAAETLILCARTISDAIPHLKNVWRPSKFPLWYDERRSLWISSIGNGRDNIQVMDFADSFLEPSAVFPASATQVSGRLPQPTVPVMCAMLTSLAKQAVSSYLKEDGMEELAYSRLLSLLKLVMDAVDDSNAFSSSQSRMRFMSRTQFVEENASLRNVSASLNAEVTRLARKMLLVEQDGPFDSRSEHMVEKGKSKKEILTGPQYVRVLLSGKKPDRFMESTTIPTFLEWGTPSICRLPSRILASAASGVGRRDKGFEERACSEFAQPLQQALLAECDAALLVLRIGESSDGISINTEATSLDVSIVYTDVPAVSTSPDLTRSRPTGKNLSAKRFFYRKRASDATNNAEPGLQLHELLPALASNLVEHTVAHPFPCALSRQRALLTSEFFPET